VYLKKLPGKYPAEMGVVVPKRTIRKATDRNLIKRRIRESYRLFKPEFYDLLNESGKQFAFMVIYQSEKIVEYDVINESLLKALHKLALNQGNKKTVKFVVLGK
jgi:ribonuclease P protein component